MNIRRAQLEDAEKIYELAMSNSLDGLKKGNRNHGFLVSNYDLELYKEYILNNRYFWVLEDEGKICAFLLAFTREEIDPEALVNKKILAYCNDDFVIIKQVCVVPDSYRQGYGTQLYSALMDEIKQNIFAAVVLKPVNKASIDFHQEMGFRVAFTVTPEDGIMRAIFFWDNPCSSFYDKEIVVNQYERAIDLYIHEDNLNWSKLNHFFYITGGLFVIASLWPDINSMSFCGFLLVISLLGMLSSWLFSIALSSGIDYLQTRKQAVVDVERILIKNKGVRIVSTHYNEGIKNKQLRKSPTTKVMKNIPLIMLIVWFMVFLATAIRVTYVFI